LRDRYDAILLDLDGTLLDGRSQLTERTIRAVRSLVDAGLFVILCTGRSLAGTQPHYETLGLDTPFVAYNGSWIGRTGGEPEHYLPIPDVHLESLLPAEGRAHFSFRHRIAAKYTVMTDHPEHHDVAAWYHNVVRADDHAGLPDADLVRLSMFFDEKLVPPRQVHEELWDALPAAARAAVRLEWFPLRLFPEYAYSSMILFEVQGKSKGKAEAFDWLERAHGIPRSRTIAVGDHMNDLTMLDGAGLAVAPANAVPDARRRAHLVIGHHAEDGVARWIEDGAPHEAATTGSR
jgi:hydroxymethylpyrimidine pyrophosphatase-like HAD family hydrolase